jgi:hypothetical protein
VLNSLAKINEKMQSSRCNNLRRFSDQMLRIVCLNMKEVATKKLEDDLTSLNYPSCVIGEKVSIGQLNFETELLLVRVRNVFMICDQLEKHVSKSGEKWSPNEILLEPLRKRFQFHFCGKKKTNNKVRPEWFMQQIKLWMKQSLTFYESLIMGPARSKGNTYDVFKHHSYLCRDLFGLVCKKLTTDMREVIEDDVLLGHYIDEILLFAKDVQELGFTRNIPHEELPVSVIENDDVFKR